MDYATIHDVAIIGGGPTGLVSSILLSLRGIQHVVFERRPGTSIHPKACGINQRTTEIFRVIGIEDEVYRHAAPAEIAGRTAWYTSLGDEGLEIISRDAWGGGRYKEEYENHGPTRYCILPQIRLEPILKRRAMELNENGIHYHSEITGIRQGEDYTSLAVARSGREEEVRAHYIIVADGGRMFTDQLKVSWLGQKNIFDMVSAHFRSPIRSLHPDPRNFITWFTHPEMGGSMKTGYLYQIGPWPLDSKNEEWVFACALTGEDPAHFSEETMIARLRKTLRIPDLPVDLISLSHWNVNAVFAERYRVGRAFLVGDASHKIPPWGALGMNSGIQDVQNLVWKIALALKDEAKYDKLLDSYDIERRPIGEAACRSSLHNLLSHGNIMDVALGMDPEKSPEENTESITAFFDPSHSEYSERRSAVAQAQKILDTEFKAPGTEAGWFYPSADIDHEGTRNLHDGQLLPDGSLNYEFHCPSTIPGHNLPHAWLERDGQRVAIRDLISLDKLILFSNALSWDDLNTDERVYIEHIGTGAGCWTDVSGDWQRQCGVSAEHGAVLIRPDGIVAWQGERHEVTQESWIGLVDRILCVTR